MLTLSVLADRLVVCKLSPEAIIPTWAIVQPFFSITRTDDELSIVCPAQLMPDELPGEQGWRALKLEGPFDFALTGILAPLAVALAEAGISILPIGTYDTDYILVREAQLESAIQVLSQQGHHIRRVSDHKD